MHHAILLPRLTTLLLISAFEVLVFLSTCISLVGTSCFGHGVATSIPQMHITMLCIPISCQPSPVSWGCVGMWEIGRPMDAGMLCMQAVKEKGMCIARVFEALLILQWWALRRGPLATCLGHSRPLMFWVTIVWMSRTYLETG